MISTASKTRWLFLAAPAVLAASAASCALVVSFDNLNGRTGTVHGTVTGLGDERLALQLNEQHIEVGDGPFTSSRLAEGSAYYVGIDAQPPHRHCTIAGGEGIIAGADTGGVEVTCVVTAGAAVDAGDAADGGDAGVPEAGADCSANPTLHDDSTGFTCPFARTGTTLCSNVETCCLPSTRDGLGTFYVAFCAPGKNGDMPCTENAEAAGSSYDGGSAWECADKNACAAAEVCCLIQGEPLPGMLPKPLSIGNTFKDVNHPPECGVKRAYNEGGSRCRKTCLGGEIALCSLSDANCASGTTCTPFLGASRELGYCK